MCAPVCRYDTPLYAFCHSTSKSSKQIAVLVLHCGPMPIHLCRAKAEQRSSLRIGSESSERSSPRLITLYYVLQFYLGTAFWCLMMSLYICTSAALASVISEAITSSSKTMEVTAFGRLCPMAPQRTKIQKVSKRFKK